MSNTTTPDTIFQTSSDLVAFWFLGYVIVSFLGVNGSKFSKWKTTTKKSQSQPRSTSTEGEYPIFGLNDHAQQQQYQQQSQSGKTEEITTAQWLENHSSKIAAFPPNWLFSVGWSILYFLMMVSFFLFFRVIEDEPGYIRDVSGIFILITLLLNKFWPIVFFQNRMPGLALAIIVFMIASAACLLGMFGVHGDLWISFGLLIPYAFWLMFACYLNVSWIFVDSANAATHYEHVN